jgi:sporulation protein YlmC with PRC-barrel domain
MLDWTQERFVSVMETIWNVADDKERVTAWSMAGHIERCATGDRGVSTPKRRAFCDQGRTSDLLLCWLPEMFATYRPASGCAAAAAGVPSCVGLPAEPSGILLACKASGGDRTRSGVLGGGPGRENPSRGDVSMRVKVIAAIAVIFAGLAGAAILYSEDQPAANNTGTNTNQQTQQTQMVRVRDLLGSQVINMQSQDLGKIEDVVINPDTGKIRYGVVGFGGMMGVGTKYLAAPWSTLRLVLKGAKTASGTTIDRDYFVLDLTTDALKNGPTFDNDHWPNFADNNWVSTIDRFYSDQRAQKAQPGTMTR